MASSDYPTLHSVASGKGSCAHDRTTESTQAKLERLSCTFANIVNTRDFDLTSPTSQELNDHIAEEWLSFMDSQPAKLSWPEQLEQWKKRGAELPDVRFLINNVASEVDETKGDAIVWLNMDVVGMAESVVLHAVNELRWKRVGVGSGSAWKCFSNLGLRGSPGNNGGLG